MITLKNSQEEILEWILNTFKKNNIINLKFPLGVGKSTIVSALIGREILNNGVPLIILGYTEIVRQQQVIMKNMGFERPELFVANAWRLKTESLPSASLVILEDLGQGSSINIFNKILKKNYSDRGIKILHINPCEL